MNVLIVSDNFLDGGLESRIIDELSCYKNNNVNVYLACKNFNPKHKDKFKKILKLKDFSSQSSETILEIRDEIYSFCKKNSINIIECHPFIYSLPAVLAANKSHIPITYTLHGLSSGNFTNTQPEIDLLYYIILKYGFDQLFAVAEYLKDLYSYLSTNIIIARNGTTTKEKTRQITTKASGKFAIASRLDAPKTKLIIDFLSTIHDIPEVKKIDIFGDGSSAKLLENTIQENKWEKVNICGWQESLIKTLERNNYDALFGMGRVILDAIASNTPAGVLGYGGFNGFINNSNLMHFVKQNLTSWENISTNKISSIINEVQKHPENFIINQDKLAIFDNATIWQKYLKVIQKIKYQNKPIISSLNLLLEENISDSLINTLKLFNNNFNDTFDIIYQKYYTAVPSFNPTIKMLQAEISHQQNEINSIKQSKLWRAIKPIRVMLDKYHRYTFKKPEIIAVLCTYNEELNIDGCLTHIEQYVNKIVIFDDCSTDKTISIAKKHPKVKKIIVNKEKNKWNERKNRESVLKQAYYVSNKKNVWALCLDPDERLESALLKNLKTIASKQEYSNKVIGVHFRELWNSIHQYRIDGIWNEKKKFIFFPLSKKMTFNYQQEHHIPWYYQELNSQEVLLDYNLYHLKMVKPVDRQARADLYNRLDPNKKMQPIGYDYLVDNTNLLLKSIADEHSFNESTVPEYYTQ